MPPFKPLFRNPHIQTIAANFWPRPKTAAPARRRMVRTEPGVEVLVVSRMPDGKPAGDIFLVHGLEGSADSGYMLGMAAAALRAGFAVHSFHMRTCGGTESSSPTLYHAGLTSDLLSVVRLFQQEGSGPAILIGFSLGGNVVLKLASELGEEAKGVLRCVCAVSAPIDLEASANTLSERRNRLYNNRFVRRMSARLCATGRYRPLDLEGARTVRDIDDRITAPSFGLGDAANYYRTQSAIAYLPGLRTPALLVQAKDDTLVPFRVFETQAVRRNPMVRLLAVEHGGHLGFLGRAPYRFWMEHAVLEWISEQMP
jgi:uncharacterized protein